MKSKSIILLITLLCLCLVFIACKKQDNNEPSSTDEPTTAATEGTNEDTSDNTSEETSDENTKEEETNPSDEDIVMAKRLEKTFDKTITVASDGYTTTKNGLTYKASGYKSVNGNRFALGKNTLTVDFDDKLTGSYNKFILCYESTAPIKATVTYLSDGKTITDDFYLEKGADTFSCLNSNYLKSERASKLISMTFVSLEGDCEFAVYSLELVDCEVYSSVTYYIENTSYKVGINLAWGGGINYIKDKNSPDRYLRNLINQHDTGRLVQQSYYGTSGDSQYTPGDYNGASWPYNPVQGGNLAQDHSRIIDIVVEEYSVYIKSQPQDWGKDNSLTPSYMENVYTIFADRIQVDNRFVDFSFYNNPYRDQELPAFYTVSYLNTFVYYNGSEGWTDDKLSYNTNLPFWGSTNASERNKCLFPLRQSNTETWCAWINQDKNYGIGLYIPNVDFFLAGTYEYDGSKDSGSDSTNYVAPLNQLKMVSGDPIEYSYIITTGSVEQMRETFKEHKDFATNNSLHKNYISKRIPDTVASGLEYDFTYSSALGTIEATNNSTANFNTTENALELRVNGMDVQTVLKFNNISFTPKAENYTKLTIKYKVPAGTSAAANSFEMFLCAGNTLTPEAGKSVNGNYICDGEYHEITIDLSKLSFWNGDINYLRFDFYGNSNVGDVLYIKSIVFHN